MKLRGLALIGVAALTATACGKDTTDVAPIGNGGSSGDSGSGGLSGASGGSAGSSDSAGAAGQSGSTDAGSDAGAARFRAVLQGNQVFITALDPAWMIACDHNPQLIQQVGGSWTALRDERPSASNLEFGAHYLDGVYQPACSLSLGCDVGGCVPVEQNRFSTAGIDWRYVAREYVKVGDRAAPACGVLDAGVELDAGPDGGIQSVPEIESRAPSGPLRVRIRYSLDSECATGAIITDVAVE